VLNPLYTLMFCKIKPTRVISTKCQQNDHLQFVFLAVDDDGRDLLIEEDEDHTQHSWYDGQGNQPPIRHIHGIDQPPSVSQSHIGPMCTRPIITKKPQTAQTSDRQKNHKALKLLIYATADEADAYMFYKFTDVFLLSAFCFLFFFCFFFVRHNDSA